MELKQAQATGTVEINELLIVPYGIETAQNRFEA